MQETLADLRARWFTAFAGLLLLSEADAARAFDDRIQITGSSKDSSPPKGPSQSLAEVHRSRIKAWQERPDGVLSELHELVIEAEFALDHARYRSPVRLDDRGFAESESERDIRVLREYEGVHEREVAVRERCTRTWVRELRHRGGRDRIYGARIRAVASE